MSTPWMQRLAGLGQGVLRVLAINSQLNRIEQKLDAFIAKEGKFEMATTQSVTTLVADWNQMKADIGAIQQKLAAALAAQSVAIDADDEAAIASTTADMEALHAQLAAAVATPTPSPAPAP